MKGDFPPPRPVVLRSRPRPVGELYRRDCPPPRARPQPLVSKPMVGYDLAVVSRPHPEGGSLDVKIGDQVPHVTVSDIENLRKLRVIVSTTSLLLHIGDFGRVDGDHAWLSIDRLRAAGLPTDPHWNEGFQAMITYAASKGWLDSAATHVRAHVDVGSGAS